MSGYLKVQFEGVGTQKLHDAIWKHNGGMWCYIELISEDDADQYL